MLAGARELTGFLEDTIIQNRHARNAGLHFVFVVRVANMDKLALRLGLDDALSVMDGLVEQLKTQLRDKDNVFRLSDRDLGVVLPNMSNSALINVVNHRIGEVVGRYCEALERLQKMPIRTHVGVAMYPEHGRNPGQILHHAFSAMIGAAKNSTELLRYSEESDEGLKWEFEMEQQLSQAIANDEFRLAYQPQMDLVSGRISGAEVLLRWKNAVLGDISPSVFIPVSETNGSIVEITEWIIQKALNQLHSWSQVDNGLGLSINISPASLRDRSFPGFLQQSMELWNVDPRVLTLEITENAMIEDPRQVFIMLSELKELGLKISIDDFGTGYSSLHYLSKLPIDELKIDQSFLRDATAWHANRKIIETILNLANNFELEVVAEGVENSELLDFLRLVGCHKAQGYFIGHPMAANGFQDFIAGRPANP